MVSNTENHSACLSVVVPVFNEEASIALTLEKVVAIAHLLEVIVVDDCSTDQTARIVARFANTHSQVSLIQHEKNKGKTAALKSGIAVTRGDIVIIQDADLEYDPEEIAEVIRPILDGHADVVYGSRFLVRRAARVLYFYHYLANKLLTFISNSLTNLNMTDIETGYKAFRGDIIRNMVIVSSGFGFEVEATAKVAKLGCAIYEVPISYYGRTYKEGKKVGLTDGLTALWLVFRFNLFCRVASSFHQLPAPRPLVSSQTISTAAEKTKRVAS